jgi:hypothetical protein
MSCLFPLAATIFVAVVFTSMASAQSEPTADYNPCTAPRFQTDVRPDADGPPTKVSVGFKLIDLMEINDVSQTMTGDFGVLLTWTDPRLAHLEGCDISLERTFPSRPRKVKVGPGGLVRYIQRYYGALATYHSLHDFPFDKQVFRIWLLSIEYAENEVQLVVDERVTGRRERLNISNWKVNSVKGIVDREYSPAYDRFHSRYDFEISANRITGYYVWKVILPLCLIVAMSWSVFWISPAQLGTQIGLSATSMLTLIAFLFATTNMLPELGYFTVLDYFIGGSTILVFLALVESLTTGYLFSKEREEISLRIDRLSRIAFPLAFVSLMVVVIFL